MTITAKPLTVPVVVGVVLILAAASAAADHLNKPEKPQRQQQPTTVQQEPEKRQNFRARRADEIPPWEGFEDCPMAFPCVGMISPHGWQN